MKHAYCILAHTDLYCLQQLIRSLDDKRNEIFIHVDKKSSLEVSLIKTEHSNIHVVPDERRKDVRWGSFSLIEAELEILGFASSKGPYKYYHLLSGQDLPIKSQDYIHSFFNSLPEGTNLIGYKDYSKLDKRNTMKRVVPFHFFRNNLRNKNKKISLVCRSIEEISSHAQRILGLRINRKIEYRKGCNWVSITQDFTQYVIAQYDYIKKILGKAIICDELLMQTLAWNSRFRNTIFNYDDEYEGCMREIDWKRGNPYTWSVKDFDYLMKSEKLFARKFSSYQDKEIIDKITMSV